VIAGSACLEAAAIGTTVVAANATDSELVAFDHGESYDTLVMHGMKPRARPLFARAYLYLPPRAAIERSMIWKAGDNSARRSCALGAMYVHRMPKVLREALAARLNATNPSGSDAPKDALWALVGIGASKETNLSERVDEVLYGVPVRQQRRTRTRR